MVSYWGKDETGMTECALENNIETAMMAASVTPEYSSGLSIYNFTFPSAGTPGLIAYLGFPEKQKQAY